MSTDLYMEMQRLRRIEKNLKLAKAMVSRPIGRYGQYTVNDSDDVLPYNRLMISIFSELRDVKFRADNEDDAKLRETEGEFE